MAKCRDCGDPATHEYVDAYGDGSSKMLCEADANYYESVGATIRKNGE